MKKYAPLRAGMKSWRVAIDEPVLSGLGIAAIIGERSVREEFIEDK
jgi:hypothetical protein